METWHVVIEPSERHGLDNYLWRINDVSGRSPYELTAFGRAVDRADALRKVADAFSEIAEAG